MLRALACSGATTAALLIAVLAPPAHAQAQARGRTYIYAFDGGLAALRDRVDAPGLIVETRFAPLFGGGLGRWSAGRLGGEVLFALAPSTARASGSLPFAATADGRSVFTGAGFARLLVAVSQPDLPVVLVAGIGAGGVAHWGGAYQGLSGKIDPAGVASLGVRLRLGRCVYGRVEVGDWIYKAGFGDVPGLGSTPSRWQHDLALSAGAELLLGEP